MHRKNRLVFLGVEVGPEWDLHNFGKSLRQLGLLEAALVGGKCHFRQSVGLPRQGSVDVQVSC